VLFACLVVGLVCLVTSPTTQHALISSSAHPDLTWLAAGDSYSSGQGLPDRSGSCAQADPQDGRGPAAWGVMAAQALANSHQLSLAAPVRLVACTGALTYQFFNGTGGKSPHPPEYTPADGKFDVVSFTFGGDNLHFTSFIEDCMFHSSCPSESQEEQNIDNLSSTYLPFLTKVANNVVVHGGQVIVVGYPLIMARPQAWPLADQLVHNLYLMGRGEAKEIRTLAVKLNTMLATDVAKANANRPNGVHFTFISLTSPDPKLGIDPGDPYLFTGHELGSGEQWLNGLEVGLTHGAGTVGHIYTCTPMTTWVLLPTVATGGLYRGGCSSFALPISPDTSFHPDVAGNSAIAHLVEQAFPHLNWSGFSVAPTTTSQTPQHQARSTTKSSSPQPTPTVGTWSAPDHIDPNIDRLGVFAWSVSCPTTTFCMAMDNAGNALTYSNGTWSAPDHIDPNHSLISVSCPTTTFCMVVDGGGNALTYSNGTWSAPDHIDPNGSLSSVSCPTTTFCMAVDDTGYALTYSNGTWSAPDNIDPNGIPSVSCPTTTFCMAVDGGGNALTYSNGTWSAFDHIYSNFWGLISVSCPTTTFCMAVEHFGGNALTYSNGTWSAPDNIDPNGSLDSVSCPTTTFCMAVDFWGNALTYSNGTWSDPNNIAPDNIDPNNVAFPALSVSCPTTTFCMAVDDAGNALTYSNGT